MTLFTQHLFSSHLFSFASSEGVSYMSVCHCSLPVAKAFCFLEDLRWEFTACFDNAAIALADRPYLFLEFGKQEKICSQFCLFYFISTVYVICFFLLSFKDIQYFHVWSCDQYTDGTIQKLKQQYNKSGGPALEVTFIEVQNELMIHPPQLIHLEEVELANGIENGHGDQRSGSGKISDVMSLTQWMHLRWYCIISFLLLTQFRIQGWNEWRHQASSHWSWTSCVRPWI